jgi:uncharacterized membrane protein YsdA (DUF1294 family)
MRIVNKTASGAASAPAGAAAAAADADDGDDDDDEEYVEPEKADPSGKRGDSLSECAYHWSTQLSIGNKWGANANVSWQYYLNLAAFVIFVIILQWFRYRQRDLAANCDDSTISASDYTIMVTKIPPPVNPKDDIDEEIKKFFENCLPGRRLNVNKVNCAYDLSEYYKLHGEKLKAIETKQKVLTFIRKNPGQTPPEGTVAQADALIQKIENDLNRLEKEFSAGTGQDIQFTGVGFVSFNTMQEQRDVLAHYEKPLLKRLFSKDSDHGRVFRGQIITIEQAPEPTDVRWQNMGVSTGKKVCRRIFTVLITIILLGGSFGIIFGINQYQDTISRDPKKKGLLAVLSLVATTLIVVINSVIAMIMRYLAE